MDQFHERWIFGVTCADSNSRPYLVPVVIELLARFSMAATCVVHPMDVIKNRMQIQRGRVSIPSLIHAIYSNEGVSKFYSGLTAGLVRQATYTTVRLGIYNQMQDFWR